MKFTYTIVPLIFVVLPLFAEETHTTRSPGDMTVEERATMMKSATQYNNCVYTVALENLASHPDIRRVADVAMGECKSHLDELSELMLDWGFEENFATGFTRNVRDRAARKILPELAIRSTN